MSDAGATDADATGTLAAAVPDDALAPVAALARPLEDAAALAGAAAFAAACASLPWGPRPWPASPPPQQGSARISARPHVGAPGARVQRVCLVVGCDVEAPLGGAWSLCTGPVLRLEEGCAQSGDHVVEGDARGVDPLGHAEESVHEALVAAVLHGHAGGAHRIGVRAALVA